MNSVKTSSKKNNTGGLFSISKLMKLKSILADLEVLFPVRLLSNIISKEGCEVVS